jgi:hypothetical protein
VWHYTESFEVNIVRHRCTMKYQLFARVSINEFLSYFYCPCIRCGLDTRHPKGQIPQVSADMGGIGLN